MVCGVYRLLAKQGTRHEIARLKKAHALRLYELGRKYCSKFKNLLVGLLNYSRCFKLLEKTDVNVG